MMKRLAVQISVLLSVSAVAAPIDFSAPLTQEAVESLSIGGTLEQKKSAYSFRAICVDQDQDGCKMASFAVLTEKEDGMIDVRTTHAGVEINQFRNDIQTLLDQRRLGKKTGRFDTLSSVIPGTAVGIGLGVLLGYGSNSWGTVIVGATVFGTVGLALDVVTAPVRLPVNLANRIVYARKLRKFLNSIVDNDREVVVRMNYNGFNAVSGIHT